MSPIASGKEALFMASVCFEVRKVLQESVRTVLFTNSHLINVSADTSVSSLPC